MKDQLTSTRCKLEATTCARETGPRHLRRQRGKEIERSKMPETRRGRH